MSKLTKKGNNYVYGVNQRFRALDSLGGLTDTFKNRFRQGIVTQLPPGWLYNTVTRRYYKDSTKVREQFKNLNNIDGVLQPASIFDYDISKIDYRTIVQKYQNPAKLRVKGPAEILNKTALQGFTGVKAYKNENRTGYDSINTIGKVIPFLKQQQLPIKIYITVYGNYLLSGKHRTILTPSSVKIITNTNDIVSTIKQVIQDIKELIEEAQLNDSGYQFVKIKSVYVNYVKYNPTKGASYIPLLFLSKSIINPKNENDNECFKWCLAIHNAIQQGQTKDLQRISKLKKYCDAYNLTGIMYPFVISKNNIKKIEDANDLSINIFHYEQKSIYPLHISSSFTTDKTKQINLLLITDDKNNKHFTYITNYNTLINKQTNKDLHIKYHCHYCLHGFTTQDILNKHINNGCATFGIQRTELPTKENNTLAFKNFNKKIKAPMAIYADFESVLQPDKEGDKHIPSGFCIYPVCINKDYDF